MIDVTSQVNAVRRQVGTRVVEAGEARTVTVSQVYDADIDDVWDACTNRDRIPRWFLPVTGDLRVGGRYQLEGNAGGTIERCDPPNSLAATWEYGGDVTWVELTLSVEGDGRTRFALQHTGGANDQRWAEFGPGAVGVGWDMGLIGLTIHLESGAAVDPREIAAWTASADGKRFMTLSSERWRDANVAAGADPTAAGIAASRTTMAYTATPE
jgi:uncharacterized protein YndB with AHSA1/START domain